MEFVEEKGIKDIDLMAINCEGGEYDLMEYLCSIDYINHIKCFYISFHTPICGVTVPDYKRRMGVIRSHLELTHHCEWSYKDTFEKWVKK
jgi:hypothetical protein